MSYIPWNYHDKIEQYHINLICNKTNRICTEITTGYFPDYDCIIGNKTLEIKTDRGAHKSGNIVIEFYNTTSNKKSGIDATKAKLWSNNYYYNNQWYIGVVPVKYLKQFIAENNFRIAKNCKNGDSNALLYIIPCSEYHNLCKEIGFYFCCNSPLEWA